MERTNGGPEMAFKPYCNVCASWHTEQEGHTALGCDVEKAECFSPDCRERGCMMRGDGERESKGGSDATG